MKKPNTCACGKGRISAYDYKCGHCRTKEQAAFARKLQDKAHQAPGLMFIVGTHPVMELGPNEYMKTGYSVEDLKDIEKAVLNGESVTLYHSNHHEAAAAHQMREFITQLVQQVILAGNQPKLY